jgi:hypothetical protein
MMGKTKIATDSKLISFKSTVVGASTLKVEAPLMWVRNEIPVQLMNGIIIIIGENDASTR